MESGLEAGLLDQEVGQHLERHLALERGLIGAIDGGHPAFPELAKDLIRTDLGPGLQLHGGIMGHPSCLRKQNMLVLTLEHLFDSL